MSSTRERPDRGQVLALFAISLTTVLLAGALAFDAGIMFVERRDQQNAADAAAIAGARYLAEIAGASKAETAARAIADDNGFLNGNGEILVDVNIPPQNGNHRGLPGYIEVEIANKRPSIFGSVMGVLDWDVGARAVARNYDGASSDFTILALDEARCKALKVTGTGDVYSYGDLLVNSDCGEALSITGGGALAIDAAGVCNVVGGIAVSGGGTLSCTENPGAKAIGDPLYDLSPPAQPGLPADAELLDWEGKSEGADPPSKGIPAGCPGADKDEASDASPKVCAFKNAAYIGTTWRLHPGLYPGGVDLSTGTFHLMPGIYYIAGGGFSAGGQDATVLTVGKSGELDTVDPEHLAMRGVMIYNTDHDSVAWKPVSLNGGYADFEMLPFQLPTTDPDHIYNNIIIFNDREYPQYDLLDPSVDVPKSITFNGGGSNFDVRGLVYSPRGQVYVNGNSDYDDSVPPQPIQFTLDKVIAGTYTFNGNGGSMLALNNEEFENELRAVGLIE